MSGSHDLVWVQSALCNHYLVSGSHDHSAALQEFSSYVTGACPESLIPKRFCKVKKLSLRAPRPTDREIVSADHKINFACPNVGGRAFVHGAHQ